MRQRLAVAIAMAIPASAIAQEQPADQTAESAWQFLEEGGEGSGAIAQAPDGSQVVLKCDKPGSREVYALIMSGEKKLATPKSQPMARPIRFLFDGKASQQSWRFYETYVAAFGKTSDRSLARFVIDLRRASTLRVMMDTGLGPDVDLSFNVAGASEAISYVYEACRDSAPR
ncbi:MAG TPA: hypothetical protein VNR60_10120 [Croceibacterium sp.]|nr:hypothetical protein [Croceibacterium sp.]